MEKVMQEFVEKLIEQINEEIQEYQFLLRNAIDLDRKDEINMWRRAIQTAKLQKRRLANS